MSLKEFLYHLGIVPKHWMFWGEDIRFKHDRLFLCPVTAVAFRLTSVPLDPGNFKIAARHIGLDEELAVDIVLASDPDRARPKWYFSGERRLRRKLLKACGLQEAK